MSPAEILALARVLRAAVTSEEVQGFLLEAIDRGLSPVEAAHAYRDWVELQASSVKTIGGAA